MSTQLSRIERYEDKKQTLHGAFVSKTNLRSTLKSNVSVPPVAGKVSHLTQREQTTIDENTNSIVDKTESTPPKVKEPPAPVQKIKTRQLYDKVLPLEKPLER